MRDPRRGMLLLLILSIAVVNLTVGYVLGARGVFDGASLTLPPMPRRRRAAVAEPEPELSDEADALTAPVVEVEAEPSAAAEAAPAGPPPKPSTSDLMAGLTDFREKLSATSVELKLSKADPNRFDTCASKLQEVNHDYLEHASTAIDRLEELGSEGDAGAAAARAAVEDGAAALREISGEIDTLVDNGLDDAGRDQLIAKSIEARDAAAKTETNAQQASVEAEARAAAEPTATAPRVHHPGAVNSADELFGTLERALEAGEDEAALLVAEVTLDPPDESAPAGLAEAALACLADTTAELLESSQSFFAGERCLLVLGADGFDEAAARVEHLRQQIASIEFRGDDTSHRATVTCGLVEAQADEGREAIEERLRQSVAEAERLGPNRTFHHDGAFPTPVPEIATAAEKRTVKL